MPRLDMTVCDAVLACVPKVETVDAMRACVAPTMDALTHGGVPWRADAVDNGRSAILAKHRRRFVRLLNSPGGMKAVNAIECLRNRDPAVRSMDYMRGRTDVKTGISELADRRGFCGRLRQVRVRAHQGKQRRGKDSQPSIWW